MCTYFVRNTANTVEIAKRKFTLPKYNTACSFHTSQFTSLVF